MSTGWKVYWLIVAATVTNYLIMILWSLPQVSEMAGGSVPFDMRPGGYSFEEALILLESISDSGRNFYLNTQHVLDFFYPGLLAVSLAIPLIHLMPRYLGWPLAAVAIVAAASDYLENISVATMLKLEPAVVTESMVSVASNWTLVKSVSTSIASVALLTALGFNGVKWFKARNNRSE